MEPGLRGKSSGCPGDTGRARSGAAGRAHHHRSVDVIMTTSYEPIMALADGNMAQSEFVSNHVTVDVITLAKENEFFDLLSRAIRRLTKHGVIAAVALRRRTRSSIIGLRCKKP